MSARRQQGGSLLEALLVLILVLIFISVASARIMELRQMAERTGVQSTIAAIQSALGLQMAILVLQQGMEGLGRLDRSNPMLLLEPAPVNYQGLLERPPAEPVAGSWYFDPQGQELVYRLRFPAQLDGDPLSPGLMRWQLQVSYQGEMVEQVRLVPLYTYRWVDG